MPTALWRCLHPVHNQENPRHRCDFRSGRLPHSRGANCFFVEMVWRSLEWQERHSPLLWSSHGNKQRRAFGCSILYGGLKGLMSILDISQCQSSFLELRRKNYCWDWENSLSAKHCGLLSVFLLLHIVFFCIKNRCFLCWSINWIAFLWFVQTHNCGHACHWFLSNIAERLSRTLLDNGCSILPGKVRIARIRLT